jgi:hypothetical protein
MTLKEQFKKEIIAAPVMDEVIDYWVSELEQVADEFAIGFAEWLTNEQSPYSIVSGNQEERFSDFRKKYTAKELLEIYKKGL